MADQRLLDVVRRIFAGDAGAGKELAKIWSEPLDLRLSRLSRDNQRRVEILLDSVFDEFRGGLKSPETFVERLGEVGRLVDGMERILGKE